MYKKLLISAGGGIICKDEQAEQAEGATIAIGLGGTGISCLRMLKKEVFERLKPDGDGEDDIQSYKHIKFLALDTDKNSLAIENNIYSINSNSEFIDIHCDDIHALLNNAPALEGDPALNWLKAQSTEGGDIGIAIQNATAGAGAVRQIGRLLLFQNVTLFVEKLRSTITDALRGQEIGASLNIHIFTGMGGGTGSGTFLDVCYLVQHVLKQEGLEGRATTCGYFFLPDVNLDRVEDPRARDLIKGNGYAAMKELDYCMNFNINGGEWKENYGTFGINTVAPPVKLAHLVTAVNQGNARQNNGYDYAMHTVVNYVMDFMVKPSITPGGNEGNFTIKSHISNIRGLIGMVRGNYGAGYEYCVIGASNEYVPFKDITTYLTSKVFEQFENLDNQLPTQNEIEGMFASLGMKFENISNALNANVPAVPVYEVDTETLYEQAIGLSTNNVDVVPQILGAMRDNAAKSRGKIEENKKALLDDNRVVGNGGMTRTVSLMAKLRDHLKATAADPLKGPYFAAAILQNGRNHDMLNVLDGYITRAGEASTHARNDLELREESVKDTLRAFQNSKKLLNRKARGREYVAAWRNYFAQAETIYRYEEMVKVLKSFKEQVSSLHDNFYKILSNVTTNLIETFNQNRQDLSRLAFDNGGFSRQIVSITDENLREVLDKVVADMTKEDLIRRFFEMLLKDENCEEWVNQDENKIAKLVSRHFSDVLSDYTHKTMKDYLAYKFDTNVPGEIQNKTKEEIIKPAYGRASVLFWGESAHMNNASTRATCSVPQIAGEIVGAAESFSKETENVSVRPSYCNDRISFLVIKAGVPLFAYNGVASYRNTPQVVGAHLHEGAKRDDRDWRRLFDVTPVSLRADLSDELRARKELVDAAFESKVILEPEAGGRKDYEIRGVDDEKYKAAKDALSHALDDGNPEEMNIALNNYGEQLPTERRIHTMESKGNAGTEKQFIKDVIMASDVYYGKVKAEMEKLEEIKRIRQKLDTMLTEGKAKGENLQIFADAVFTGAIHQGENRFSYVLQGENMGLLEEIELTNYDKKPYGANLPLYSAYIEFSKLESDKKNDVLNGIRDRRINKDEEVSENFEKVREGILSDQSVKNDVDFAKMTYPTEANSIKDFYGRMLIAKKAFR